MNKTLLHAAAGAVALLLVATFWTSTVVAELLLDRVAIAQVKQAIACYGLPALVLALVLTGASGFSLGRHRQGRLVEQKRRRMPVLAINGLVVMVPAALFLHQRASAELFDPLFYAVQGLELLVGLVQLTMLSRNFKAGLSLAGRRPQHHQP